MDTYVKEMWLDALTNGTYQQTQNQLYDGNGFCCLGVLCDLHRLAHGGEWKYGHDDFEYEGAWSRLPRVVIEWAKLEDDNPMVEIDEFRDTLANLNDGTAANRKRYSFAEIATLIKDQL